MRQVNLDGVNEAGEFTRLPAGGYVCQIKKVEDISDKEYLQINYDIAAGEFKDHYKGLEESAGFWGGVLRRSYKQSALPFFKRMCSAVSRSNPGFVFDGGRQNADEQTLVGKMIGLILGEEEYVGNDGNVKTRLYVYSEVDVAKIKAGDFKVPDLRRKPGVVTADPNTFMGIPAGADDEVPFN